MGVSLKWWVSPFHTPKWSSFLVGKPHGLLGKPAILRKHPYGSGLLVFGPFRPKAGPKKGQVVRKGKVVQRLGQKDPSNETNVEASAGAQRPVPEAEMFLGEKKTGCFPKRCHVFFPWWKIILADRKISQNKWCVYFLLVKNRYWWRSRKISGWFCWYFASVHSFTLDFLGDFRHGNLPLLVCDLLVIGLRGEHAVDCFSQEMEPHDFCKLDLMFSRNSTTTAINNTINNTAITRTGTWINL